MPISSNNALFSWWVVSSFSSSLEKNAAGDGKKVNTAVLYPDKDKLLPPNGVYFSKVTLKGEKYYGVTNIGNRPTVKDGCKVSKKKIQANFTIFYHNPPYGFHLPVKGPIKI